MWVVGLSLLCPFGCWLVKDSMLWCGFGVVLCFAGMLLYLGCLNMNMSGGKYEF